jgi:alpha-galactosidase
MITKNRIKTVLALAAVAMAILILPVAAKEIPAQLPDPDGKAPDTTKPVKVYILAGQSNMVGFGTLKGARCPYSAIYLTTDPDAPMGPFQIYRGGNYKIAPLGIYVSADKNAGKGATAFAYKGTIALGDSTGSLLVKGGQTCVVQAFIEVPESGNYICSPGYGDSSYNVMELDGKEVYKRNIGQAPVRQKVTLKKGKRYPIKITYFKGGSTAFWMAQVDLLGKGDLEVVTKRDNKFPWMIDDEGNWTVRNDVYYQEVRIAKDGRGCPLSATSNGKFIGPEVPFGYVMGAYHDEQVLLIESSMGNRALSYDFRPPSSGRTDPESKWEGLEYRLMIEGVHKTLKNIDKVVPGYNDQGYEISGFVWWQGHKDGGAGVKQAEYEKHMVNMINDLRKEFKTPKMPAVIATVGFGGYNLSEKDTETFNAQMAVGDPKLHPEFAGHVKTVDTRGFWRESDESPTGTGYHYNHNAETYMLTGDALGRAMVELQGGTAEPLPYGNRPEPDAKVKAPAATEKDPAAAQIALEPIIVDGMMQGFIEEPRNKAALAEILRYEKPQRANQFLRDTMYALNNYYIAAGVDDYNWHNFGPDLANVKWDYHSFEPAEKMTKDRPGGRYRKVTYSTGMDNWASPDFDAKAAGWQSGLPPFGQKGGKLEALRGCPGSPCGCGVAPRTLWDKEVILIRKTIDVPSLKEGHRYRIVIGGSNHVKTGEGYAIYINGKLLYESASGVPNRQGGQPRGGHIYEDFRDEFKNGKVTIAVKSFLRYGVRGPAPQGHLTVWLEEQKLPPLVLAKSQ